MGWFYPHYIPSISQTQFFENKGCTPDATLMEQNMLWAAILQCSHCLILSGYAQTHKWMTSLFGIDQLLHSPLVENWKLQITITGSLNVLWQDLLDSHRFAVSNGSYQDHAGMAAWIIEGSSTWSCIIRQMIMLGNHDDHSSFWSKLAGIYGTLLTLEALNLGCTNLSCQIACDGKSVLVDCIQSSHPVLPTEPHADLLQTVWTKVAQIGIQIKWCHVKGHQDGKRITALPCNAWLNVEADCLAKTKVNPTHQGPLQYQLPGEGWMCYIGTKQIVKQLSNAIWEHINGQLAKKYWQTKFYLSDTQWQTINWPGIGHAYKELSPNMWCWAIKNTSGFFVHGKNMAHWQYWATTKCPHCEHEMEDKHHITQCSSEAATNTWTQSLKKLKQWFCESKTAHEIAEVILGDSTNGVIHKKAIHLLAPLCRIRQHWAGNVSWMGG